MSADFRPTAEQEKIVASFSEQLSTPASVRSHLLINAAAGAGKTSTLRLMSTTEPKYSGLYVAFNKSVATSASKTFGRNVECLTSHALAYRFVRDSRYSHLLVKLTDKNAPQRDDRQALARDFGMYQQTVTVLERRNSGVVPKVVAGQQLVSIAISTLERFCQTAAKEPSAAHVVPPKNFVPADFESYRSNVWAKIKHLVMAMWDDILDVSGKYMKVRHDHYLKVWQISQPVLPYDFIFLDEAQDTAPVVEDVVLRQAGHALLVMVGDQSQAIYGFTGARDSMSRLQSSCASVTELTLSESFRFGSEIAGAANSLLALSGRDLRITGRGRPGEVLHHLSDAINEAPSVYVCRSNFDVIQAALESIGRGLSVDTSSVDLSDVEDFLRGARELMAGRKTSQGGLQPYGTWAEFVLDYEDGVPTTEGQRVGMMLLEKYTTVDSCLEKINLIRASATAHADVKVITIHKAKGGEWVDVSVRYDSAFRKVKDKDDKDRQWWELSDVNLAYVAVTRAIEVLDPGRLWPVVEYGIVCDPMILHARMKALCTGVGQEVAPEWLLPADDPAFVSFVQAKRPQIASVLTGIGVKDAEASVAGAIWLIRDIAHATVAPKKVAVSESGSETVAA